MKTVCSLVGLMMLVTGTACSLFSGQRVVELHVPELPTSWQGFAGHIELLVEVNGVVDGTSEPGSTLRVSVPASGPSVFRIRPRIRNRGVYLLPAGGVSHGDEQEVHASWADGPLASILLKVARAEYPLERVNITRLREEILDRAGPYAWSIRIPQVVSAIVHERMRVFDLAPQSRVAVQVTGPAGEAGSLSWVRADPLLTDVLVPDQNDRRELTIPTGTHQFVAIDGSSVIVLQLHDDGTPVLISR